MIHHFRYSDWPMAPSQTARQPIICLVSSHQIVLAELNRILEAGKYEVVTTKLGDTKLASSDLPAADLYVIDSESVGGATSNVVNAIGRAYPGSQMLVLAEQFTEDLAFPLLNMGVKGLVTLDVMRDQLPRAVDALCSGGFWVPRGLLATFVDSVIARSRKLDSAKPGGAEISRREHDIMDGLLLNLSNKEIASRLNISERTVKFHVSNLLTKFSVQRRADLILLWYQQKSNPAEAQAGSSTPRRVQ